MDMSNMNEQVKDSQETGNVNNSNVFHQKKRELKVFSENFPRQAQLPSVPNSGGLFGWFNYGVTGSDLNRLTESIQDKMIEQNRVILRTIKEFNTVYDTFCALDKEYIQGILISLKAAEEANAKALKGIEGVQTNQNEIKQIIDQQKFVIQVLKNFKDKTEKIEHLADVDKMFAVFSHAQSMTVYLESELTRAKDEIRELNLVTRSLSKVLKNTRIVSFASIAIMCIVAILIMNRVL